MGGALTVLYGTYTRVQCDHSHEGSPFLDEQLNGTEICKHLAHNDEEEGTNPTKETIEEE